MQSLQGKSLSTAAVLQLANKQHYTNFKRGADQLLHVGFNQIGNIRIYCYPKDFQQLINRLDACGQMLVINQLGKNQLFFHTSLRYLNATSKSSSTPPTTTATSNNNHSSQKSTTSILGILCYLSSLSHLRALRHYDERHLNHSYPWHRPVSIFHFY